MRKWGPGAGCAASSGWVGIRGDHGRPETRPARRHRGRGRCGASAGVTAAFTTLPVIGVPIESRSLKGLDSLLSIVQMPPGVPVATVGIGAAKNAGLLAVQILAVSNPALQKRLAVFKRKLAAESRAKNKALAR